MSGWVSGSCGMVGVWLRAAGQRDFLKLDRPNCAEKGRVPFLKDAPGRPFGRAAPEHTGVCQKNAGLS